MFRSFCLALGLALSCFAAVAKTPVVPTPIAHDLPVELILNQHEIAIDVPATATAVGMQFGLIGALIGSAIQNSQAKKAEERVVPLRDMLVEYRFNEHMEAAIRAKLASEGLSPNPQLTVRQTPWDAAEANAQPAAMQVLVIVPRYAMSYELQQLTVTLMASLIQRTPKANGKYKTKALFSRNYSFDFPMLAAPGQDGQLMSQWSALGSVGMSRVLDQGIEQVTDMLVHDFSPAGRAEWGMTGKGQVATVAGRGYPGQQVRQGEGWAWVRSGKGWMQALQGHRPLDAAAISALSAPAVAPAPAAEVPAPATELQAPTAELQAPAAAAAAEAAPVGSGG